MTTHEAMIAAILTAGTTGYTINSTTQESIAPSINLFFYTYPSQRYSSKTEEFLLYIKATSVTNLETILITLLQLDSRHNKGYKRTVTGYPEALEITSEYKHDAFGYLKLTARWIL